MRKADITINIDTPCPRCGRKGATQDGGGVCLQCVLERIKMQHGSEAVQFTVRLKKISSTMKVDKDGGVDLVTAIGFEGGLYEDAIKRLIELQHCGPLCVTVEPVQPDLPGTT